MFDHDEKFERIVTLARRTNPFYAEWLRGRETIPILTRRVVLENNDRILNGYPVTATTSGSTGVPVRISMSPERRRVKDEMSWRYVQWLGGPLVRSQIVVPRGMHPEMELSIDTPIEQQIEWIVARYEKARAVALITYPTNAVMLCQAIIETGRDMSFMQRVGLISETFDRGERALVQRAFPRAMIWSSYSTHEFGLIAGQCPHQPDFHHIMSDCFRVEIVDDDDAECAEGKIGRVIITDYLNECSPFIRYDIGDLAALGDCPCGRILFPAFSALLGKVRGALKHRSGQRVYFHELSNAMRDMPGIKQHQVVQEDLERFTVRLVADRSHEDEIAAAFEAHFGYRPQLTFEYHDVLPREPNGKFFYSICRV